MKTIFTIVFDIEKCEIVKRTFCLVICNFMPHNELIWLAKNEQGLIAWKVFAVCSYFMMNNRDPMFLAGL